MGGVKTACTERFQFLDPSSFSGSRQHVSHDRRPAGLSTLHSWRGEISLLARLRTLRRCGTQIRPAFRTSKQSRCRPPVGSHIQQRWPALSADHSLGHAPLPTRFFTRQTTADRTPAVPGRRQRQARRVRCQAAPKIANLTASRTMAVPLPVHTDSEGRPRKLSEFLKLPVGRESMLKGQSCKKRELIGDNTFRCYLRSIEAFKFSVAPVIDVRVTSTDDTCTVEMLQCRFLGSEAVERQSERFSATFKNHIDWRESGEAESEEESGKCRNGEDEDLAGNGAAEPLLRNDIQLDLALEVFTPPFTMLPIAAVERPGSAFLQALLDRVAPAFVSSLLADYEAWAKGELEETDTLSTDHLERHEEHDAVNSRKQ
ncbi:hypothetical protein KFL_001940040 [Klebsormidium nitens]|uniref:DUF1997 family protein n=1 Tax=Klebsormidium nitens TaxID=105231 RepID=A0A1Y1I746_KLENI|nr:hypothetical protein KFL_001940040 [Klebsormidium nitens]|eukprot:GAQ84547.1 hypothetical protein KFL_001940040 [Klebsormidium nitens]